jgi:hypothetical protein
MYYICAEKVNAKSGGQWLSYFIRLRKLLTVLIPASITVAALWRLNGGYMLSAETIRPEDVIVGLLAEVKQKMGSERFEADPVNMHSRFFEWRDKEQFSKFFDLFVFDNRDYFPYSETLDQVLDGLQLAGYLERTNPRGTYYVITPALESLFESNVKSRFGAPQLQALEALAAEFVREVKVVKRSPAAR